ncbi:MAG TPA: hypothetical protein ENJ08_05215 [Gammaproteobacteria bacterium]|nr:hypothetical protein [Gammaproteobacteria bacterium]
MNSVNRFLLLIFVILLAACVPQAAFDDYYTELVNAKSETDENRALVAILQLARKENLPVMYSIYSKNKNRDIDASELADNMNDEYSVVMSIESLEKAILWNPRYNQNLLPLILAD